MDVAVSLADVRRLIGMGGDKLLPAIAKVEADSPLGRKVSRRRTEIFEQRHLPTLRAFPKTRELLLRMRGAGLALAVASSAKKEELGPFLEIANVTDLIEDATSSSEARNSKPDPDIVHAAVRKSQVSAAGCVMLGDTPYDVEAARKAGVQIVALRCGGWGDEALAGAVEIYDDPKHLLGAYTESLIGRRFAARGAGNVRRGESEGSRRRSGGGEEFHAT